MWNNFKIPWWLSLQIVEITQITKSSRWTWVNFSGSFYVFRRLLLISPVTLRVTTWVHSKSKSPVSSLKARTKLYIQAFFSAGRHILPPWWWPHVECDTDVCLPHTTFLISPIDADLCRCFEKPDKNECPNRPKALPFGKRHTSHSFDELS